MSGYWVSRREVDKQYRPKGYGLSPGLQRARAPFRTRNAITGIAIGVFVVGVWAYSISAVKQDTFEDLDEEAKELLAARMADERIKAAATASSSTSSKSAKLSSNPIPGGQALSSASATVPSPPGPTSNSHPHGVLASQLHRHFPSVLDPASRTLIWGAPPVDRIGRLGDKNDRPT